MRNKHNHQYMQQQKEPTPKQRSITFLPMLCSSSTKDVKLSHRRCASSSSASSSISEDPSSPKVGCMGQVKRNNQVVGFPSIISFSSNITSSTTSISTTHAIKCHNQQHEQNKYTSNSIVKYHKLKRFFSSKSLTSSPTSVITAARATANSGSHKAKCPRNNSGNVVNNRGRVTTRGSDHQHHGVKGVCKSKADENNLLCVNNKNCNDESLVKLVDLDPPLPVVKKQGNELENGSTLWKRRSGGVPLKGLQLQVMHHNTNLVTATTL